MRPGNQISSQQINTAYDAGRCVREQEITETIKARIKNIEGNGHTVLTATRVEELKDLLNDITTKKQQ